MAFRRLHDRVSIISANGDREVDEKIAAPMQ